MSRKYQSPWDNPSLYEDIELDQATENPYERMREVANMQPATKRILSTPSRLTPHEHTDSMCWHCYVFAPADRYCASHRPKAAQTHSRFGRDTSHSGTMT